MAFTPVIGSLFDLNDPEMWLVEKLQTPSPP